MKNWQTIKIYINNQKTFLFETNSYIFLIRLNFFQNFITFGFFFIPIKIHEFWICFRSEV